MKKETTYRRLGELDAFRGIAALAVVFFHATMFRPEAELGFYLGIAGVDFFFMISGFVILMTAERQKHVTNFVWSRLIRIYPIYWVVASFTFLYYLVFHLLYFPVPYVDIPFYDYAVNLTMLQYYFEVPDIDGSYWTLIIELLFYAFIFILISFKVLDKIVKIGAVFCGFILVYFIAINLGWVRDFSSILPLLYHFPLFYMGILFYKLFKGEKNYVNYSLLLLGSFFIQLYISDYSRTINFMSAEEYSILLLAFIGLFLLFINGKIKFISNKVTSFFGRISYALYLVHQTLIYGFIIPLFVDFYGYNFWLITLAFAVPLSILIATIFTFYIEIPMMRYLRKTFIKKF